MTKPVTEIKIDPNIVYGMPIPLVFLYKKIIRFLGNQEKNNFALVVTEKGNNWTFYISNIHGRFIHRIFIDNYNLDDKRERNVDYYFTTKESKKITEQKIANILENVQNNIAFQSCGNSPEVS